MHSECSRILKQTNQLNITRSVELTNNVASITVILKLPTAFFIVMDYNSNSSKK